MPELHVEVTLGLEHITGEPEAHGTADALIVHDDELIVVDLKYGIGVPVVAERNPQLMIYGLAALQYFELSHDIQRVRLVICQPRLHSVSEWVISAEDLREFGVEVAVAAEMTRKPDAPLVPSTKGCRWCKAKATCPALRNEVFEAVEEHDPHQIASDDLAKALTQVERIEQWCKAIKAEAEARLLDGRSVPGFKLVAGRAGARKWTSPSEVEAMLKSMRLKAEDMYERSLISPTTAEKLVKDHAIGERQWQKLQAHITQSKGSPAVVPVTDRRPEYVPVAESFSPVSST